MHIGFLPRNSPLYLSPWLANGRLNGLPGGYRPFAAPITFWTAPSKGRSIGGHWPPVYELSQWQRGFQLQPALVITIQFCSLLDTIKAVQRWPLLRDLDRSSVVQCSPLSRGRFVREQVATPPHGLRLWKASSCRRWLPFTNWSRSDQAVRRAGGRKKRAAPSQAENPRTALGWTIQHSRSVTVTVLISLLRGLTR